MKAFRSRRSQMLLLKEGHPVDAVQLALAAWPRKGDEKRPQMRRVITALVFALSEHHEHVRLEGHRPVRYAAFSPDGKRVITASEDKTAHIWDAKTGKHLIELKDMSEIVWSAAFRPGWRSRRHRVRRQDGPHLGRQDRRAPRRAEWALAKSPSSSVQPGWRARRHRVRGQDGPHLERRDRQASSSLQGHHGEVWSAAFSPDGARIVTASVDKTARIWDAETGKPLVEPLSHRGEVYSAAFSPDGTRIVTASEDGTARIWNAKTGKAVGELKAEGDGDTVSAAAFSPDGARIVTASYDNTARIWDVGTKTVLIELKGHDNVVNSAAFSADGTHIVTASDDKTARIWDTAGMPFITLKGHEDYVYSVAFSPDGARIVTASRD